MKSMSFSAKDLLLLLSFAFIHAFAVAVSSSDIAVGAAGHLAAARVTYTAAVALTLLSLGLWSRAAGARRVALAGVMLPFPLAILACAMSLVLSSGGASIAPLLALHAFLGVANGCVLIRVGLSFSALSRKKAFTFAAMALVVAGVILVAVIAMDETARLLAVLVLLVASAAMAGFTRLPVLDTTTFRLKERRFPLELVSSYVDGERKVTFFVIMFFYCVAFGYWSFGSPVQTDEGVFTSVALSTLLSGLVALAYVRLTRAESDLFLAQWALLALLVVGVAIQIAGGGSVALANAAIVVVAVGFSCYDMSNWLALYEVSQGENPGYIFGIGRAVMSLGVVIGRAVYQGLVDAFPDQANGQATFLFIIVCIFFFCLVLANLRILGSNPGQQDGEGAETDKDSSDITRVCEALSSRYRLTPRESEVLGLLARGRNVEFIQEALVVSKYTARSHVYHVYQKLGVHTHQELISLVERETP